MSVYHSVIDSNRGGGQAQIVHLVEYACEYRLPLSSEYLSNLYQYGVDKSYNSELAKFCMLSVGFERI